ncbi:MAG: hypothetical protein GC129_07305 [Proteobacteria bacterium]|nr:hypothetical protein [Pseudomonadota bacterium]
MTKKDPSQTWPVSLRVLMRLAEWLKLPEPALDKLDGGPKLLLMSHVPGKSWRLKDMVPEDGSNFLLCKVRLADGQWELVMTPSATLSPAGNGAFKMVGNVTVH